MNEPDQHFETPLVCIIGAPRSGTTWLQAMIGAHPAIATAPELKLFDLFTVPWEQSWRQLDELQRSAGGGPRGLRSVWSDADFHRRLIDVMRDVYGRVLAAKPGARVVLDKSPSYSPHVLHIRRLAPQVRFIHMLRDGRDVAVSLRVAARRWARMWAPAGIAAAATLWRKTVCEARQASRFGPSAYLELRYEDLLADGPTALLRAFALIGVPASTRDVAAIVERFRFDAMQTTGGHPFDLPPEFFHRGQAGGWRSDLSARERYVFQTVAGDLLQELGYAGPSWWVERPHERWLLPLVEPAALPRALRRVRERWRPARRPTAE